MSAEDAREFEVLEHTADIGIKAYGTDLPQAFANVARCMFSLITDLGSIRETISRAVEVGAPDREMLLVGWLNELVYLFDTEQLLFGKFEIEELTDNHLRAKCRGEKVDPQRHELKIAIKAVTYHMLKIESLPGGAGFQMQVLLDI